jgi:AcrR family transcriptional regulator
MAYALPRSAIQPTPAGNGARQRILDVAQAAVLKKGFAGASIEEIIVAVGITKSGFFYHFTDKGELAHALLERYLAREEVLSKALNEPRALPKPDQSLPGVRARSVPGRACANLIMITAENERPTRRGRMGR